VSPIDPIGLGGSGPIRDQRGVRRRRAGWRGLLPAPLRWLRCATNDRICDAHDASRASTRALSRTDRLADFCGLVAGLKRSAPRTDLVPNPSAEGCASNGALLPILAVASGRFGDAILLRLVDTVWRVFRKSGPRLCQLAMIALAGAGRAGHGFGDCQSPERCP